MGLGNWVVSGSMRLTAYGKPIRMEKLPDGWESSKTTEQEPRPRFASTPLGFLLGWYTVEAKKLEYDHPQTSKRRKEGKPA